MMPIFRTHTVTRRDKVREWATIIAAYAIAGIIIAAVCVGPAVIVSWITGGFS